MGWRRRAPAFESFRESPELRLLALIFTFF
jgi:hypothetical protein